LPPLPGEQRLLDFAQSRVFRLATDKANGSAVLVELVDGPSRARIGTFVTTYHVLEGARQFTLRDSGGHTVAESTDATRCYQDRDHELALVRLTLKSDKRVVLGVMPLVPYAPVPSGTGMTLIRPPGLALGFSQVGSVPLDFRRLEFLGESPALAFEGLLDNEVVDKSQPGGQSPGSALFQEIMGERTEPGMSGGLILDYSRRFAGLVLGWRPDNNGLIIPAEVVADAWEQARGPKAAARWRELKDAPFAEKSFFGGRRVRDLALGRIEELTGKLQAMQQATARLLDDLNRLPTRHPAEKALAEELDRLVADYKRNVDPRSLSEEARRILDQAEARSRYARGDYAGAIKKADPDKTDQEMEEGEKKWRSAVASKRLIADAYFQQSQWREAAKAFERIVKTPFATTTDGVMLAQCLYQLKDLNPALQRVNQLLGSATKAPPGATPLTALSYAWAFGLRADILADLKEPGRAAADVDAAVAAFDSLLNKEDLRQGTGAGTRLQIQHTIAILFNRKASILFERGPDHFDEAQAASTEAIARLGTLLRTVLMLRLTTTLGLGAPVRRSELPPGIREVISALASQYLIRGTMRGGHLATLAERKPAAVTESWYREYERGLGDLWWGAALAHAAGDHKGVRDAYTMLQSALGVRAWLRYQAGAFSESRRDMEAQLKIAGVLRERYKEVNVAEYAAAATRLAWLLATCPDDNIRDGKRAVASATMANEFTKGTNASVLTVLAAAYAEAGKFDLAVKTQEKALGLVDGPEKGVALAALEVYRRNKAVRYDPRVNPMKK
jgi:hypothetical protein